MLSVIIIDGINHSISDKETVSSSDMRDLTLSFLLLWILVGVVRGQEIYSSSRVGRVSFPLRNVMHTIDLGTGETSDLYVPTGRCEDVSDGRIVLILPGVGLRKLYPGIIESIHVSCLSLPRNIIDNVEVGTFDRLPSLMFLDLSRNRIPFCDLLTFGGHQALRTLILDENEPPGLGQSRAIARADFFPRLEHLYLRKNALGSLDFSLRRSFPTLTHLYLSDNRVVSENFVLDVPTTLTHLHLERNQIRHFSGEILRNLRALFLDDNEISSICYGYCVSGSSLNLQTAWGLRVLSLSKNNIVSIDREAFRDTCNLTTLNLADNMIEIIEPSTFDSLVSLQELSLKNNRLRTVPDVNRLTLLTSLSLSHNEIEIVTSGALCYLSSLKWLSLGANKIGRIEVGALRDLSVLEELDLSDNRLDRLTRGWLTPQLNLRRLNVRGNRFTCLEHLHIDGAPLLTSIYMQNNFVKHIGARDFVGMGPDVVVYLENECKTTGNPCYDRCDEERRNARVIPPQRW